MTVLLLEPVSFSGIDKRELTKPDMYFENCTARWKKHLVKKPVANVFKRTHERRNANNFAVGLRRKSNQRLRNQSFDSYSD